MFGMVGFCEVEVKPLGPLHEYVAPAMLVAVKLNVCNAHKGELAVAVGVIGAGFTVTARVPGELVQPPTVVLTEYVPLPASVMAEIEGFCKLDVNPLGPVQVYVPPVNGVVKFKVCPAHKGELEPMEGVVGVGAEPTAMVLVKAAHPDVASLTFKV